MNFLFRKIFSEDDARFIYELYRETGEPDAPNISFDKLPQERKQFVLQKYQEINELLVDKEGRKIGFVTVTSYENGVNVGGAILPEFRNRNIATEMLQVLANRLIREKCDKPIFASARSDNRSAIKVINKAGFTFVEKKEMPPIGRFTQPIEYSFFKFQTMQPAE